MSCFCDQNIHPRPLAIMAGSSYLPRRIGDFTQFKRAMLQKLTGHAPLFAWKARCGEDLGIMLLEMWAYVCDVTAFYDEVIAHECYLRTARLPASLLKLVHQIGYQPCPAVAAAAKLAVFVEGTKPVVLPRGSSFRCGAFGKHPPQVFELSQAVSLNPLLNRWTLKPSRPPSLAAGSYGELLLKAETAQVRANDILLILVRKAHTTHQPLTVQEAERIKGKDGHNYLKIRLNPAFILKQGVPWKKLAVLKPGQEASLWNLEVTGAVNPAVISQKQGRTLLILDSLYRSIKAGQFLLLRLGTQLRWFRVWEVKEIQMTVSPAKTVKVDGKDTVLPGVTTPVTRVTLDTTINHSSRKPQGKADWGVGVAGKLVLHYQLKEAGEITAMEPSAHTPGSAMTVQGGAVGDSSQKIFGEFLLEDKGGQALSLSGELALQDGAFTPQPPLDPGKSYAHPLSLYGNVIAVTRGESVQGEILGSGNGSLANQRFKLKKKPLTYLSSPALTQDLSAASTLRVYVNGRQWQEVRYFYNRGPGDKVYTVQQDEEEYSYVTFGDGLRGARLPTGTDNIRAGYRFGAGAAAPPAGSITQMAKPVKGVQSIKQPLDASAGSDRESTRNMRGYAPRSALLLGRVVSVKDMEAAVSWIPGVKALRVNWQWHQHSQRALALVWYIGAVAIEVQVRKILLSLAEPGMPIQVQRALPVPVVLALDIEVDSRFKEGPVLGKIAQKLLNAADGLLHVRNIGIGEPLFQSRLFQAVLEVQGASGVRKIFWNNQPFSASAQVPPPGHYFHLAAGALILNGKEYSYVSSGS